MRKPRPRRRLRAKHSKRGKRPKGTSDVNQIIANLEDARTSIEEARVEEDEQQRDVLLDDAMTSVDNAMDQLEEGDTKRSRSKKRGR